MHSTLLRLQQRSCWLQAVTWDIWEFFASDWARAEAKRIHDSAGAAARAAEAARRYASQTGCYRKCLALYNSRLEHVACLG